MAPLPPRVDRLLNDFVESAKKSFAERLSSIVLFGTAAEGRLRATSDVNVIVVLTAFKPDEVTLIAPTLRLARAIVRLDVMYLMVDEIPAVVECFAQKFGDIARRHRVLHGPDPFANLAPSRAAEIYRLRQVVLGLQLHMRQGFAERAGQEDQVARLLADSAGPMRSCAATVMRLENQGSLSPKEALERLADSLNKRELSEAVSDMSNVREQRAAPSGNIQVSFFHALELVEKIRDRAWRLT
jgi:predicted nucleotidyltransferase